MSSRQGHNIRFRDHTSQLAGLCEHDVPQILHRKVSNQRGLSAEGSITHQFTEHAHNELEREVFPQLQDILKERRQVEHVCRRIPLRETALAV